MHFTACHKEGFEQPATVIGPMVGSEGAVTEYSTFWKHIWIWTGFLYCFVIKSGNITIYESLN